VDVSGVELKRVGGTAYREAVPDGPAEGAPVLCLHGFPESSYMWRELLEALGADGRRALAPDLPAIGDSEPDHPSTWERLVEHVESFVAALDLDPVVLVVHDWGGLIGLRWACDHPQRAAALVISNTGFFADGNWSGMAEGLRTPETGEQMLESLDRESFGQMLSSLSAGFGEDAADAYWHQLGSPAGRQAALDMYRSGDFEKLAPYEGRLGELNVPTLLLWGENDEFAPVGGAHRLHKRIPGAALEVVEGAGHFVYADAPARCSTAVTEFLATI
jgi:haloalkane dehalogenase